jgi:hypothetical protein
MQKIILLLTVLSAFPRPSVAQKADALHQGVRIEVTPVNAKSRAGTLMSLRNDSLFYAPGTGRAQLASLALADIKSIRVSRGRNHLAGAVTKGLAGAGIGIVTGGLIAAATWKEDSMDFFCGGSRGACAAFGAMMGGGFGLATGTIYGAIQGNEHWETVDLRRR